MSNSGKMLTPSTLGNCDLECSRANAPLVS